MISGLVLGGALGAAVCFLAWTLIPDRPDHTVVLARLDAARAATATDLTPAASPAGGHAGQLRRRAGTRLAGVLQRHGIKWAQVRQDLAIQDKTLEEHLGTLSALFLGVLVALLLIAALFAAGGVGPAAAVMAPLALLLAAAVTSSRHQGMRRAAAARRRVVVKAVRTYHNLVGGLLQNGVGVIEALPRAAAEGTAWPWRMMFESLDRAKAVGHAPWAELSELGERIGVVQLRDLGPTLALVGEDGARIAHTLYERADTMHRREISDVQGRAAERDTSMRVAIFLCGIGFLTLLMYPLITNFLNF